MKKHGHLLAIALMALALSACGGSGSDNGGGGNDEPLGLTNTPRIEAVLADPTLDPGYLYQDPLSLQTGDTVRFQLVNYTGSGSSIQRNVLPVDSFNTNDSRNTTGVLSTTNGFFQAANTDTGNNQYIVTAFYQGVNYSAFYKINPRQIRLRGKVLAEGSGEPVYNAVIDFYAPRNPLDATSAVTLVQTIRTASDGTFRVSLPAFNDAVDTVDEANAAPRITFTIRRGQLPSGYYPSFVFKGKRFEAGSNVCRATLVSNTSVTDTDTGETAFLPFTTGDRYLINGDDLETNGTILLTPTSLYESKPESNGCSQNPN